MGRVEISIESASSAALELVDGAASLRLILLIGLCGRIAAVLV